MEHERPAGADQRTDDRRKHHTPRHGEAPPLHRVEARQLQLPMLPFLVQLRLY